MYTSCVVSILISNQEPSTAIDMWSIGCIVAELIVRRPIFPVTAHSNHLSIVKQVIGPPSGPRRNWIRFYSKLEEMSDLPDFLNQLIAFNPTERLV